MRYLNFTSIIGTYNVVKLYHQFYSAYGIGLQIFMICFLNSLDALFRFLRYTYVSCFILNNSVSLE